MPELPEVETTKRGIEPYLVNQVIESLVVRQPKLRWPIPAELAEKITGQTILSVTRRGKYIGVHTSAGSIIIHLGMSGSLYLVEKDTPPLFHDHVDIHLNNNHWLRYTDPRRFGSVLWHERTEPSDQFYEDGKLEPEASTREWLEYDWFQHTLIANLGPEPLTDAFNSAHLVAAAKGKKQAVKTFIMDSKKVVGVGNIYANEALFLSGINPHKAAGKISAKKYAVLVNNIKQVLEKAIEQGGTTLKDFVGGDGKPGYFKQSLNVYGRAGETCVHCGSILAESRLGQRSTVFCKKCQK